MRNSPFWWVLIGFMVLLDIYVFQVVKYLSHSAGVKTRLIIYTVYWVVSITAIIIFVFNQFRHLFKGWIGDFYKVYQKSCFTCF